MEEKWGTATSFTEFVVSLVFQKFLTFQFDLLFSSREKTHLHADLGIFKKTLFKMRWNSVFQIRINAASPLKSSSDGLEGER